MRITQQEACYAAEAALDRGAVFTSVDAAQRWVDDLRDTHWWHLQRYSLHVLRIEVRLYERPSKFAAQAKWQKDANAGVITARLDSLNAAVLLHEVAHVLADAMYDSTGHDPAWAMTYLTLVSCVMGSEAYLTLQRSFDEHGVNYDVTPKSSGVFAL